MPVNLGGKAGLFSQYLGPKPSPEIFIVMEWTTHANTAISLSCLQWNLDSHSPLILQLLYLTLSLEIANCTQIQIGIVLTQIATQFHLSQ